MNTLLHSSHVDIDPISMAFCHKCAMSPIKNGKSLSIKVFSDIPLIFLLSHKAYRNGKIGPEDPLLVVYGSC